MHIILLNIECTLCHMICLSWAGDIKIPDGMTFSENLTLNGGSPQFTFTCISVGGPATNVTWTRDSETLSGGMTVLDDPVTAQYTHNLTVTGREGGLYQCTVANSKPSSATAQFVVPCSTHGLTCTLIIGFSQHYYSVTEGKSLAIPVQLNRSPNDVITVNMSITPGGYITQCSVICGLKNGKFT